MDKVLFQALERLDLVDADALQDLVYTYVMEAIGGIMGYSVGGALTRMTFDNTSATTMSLGPFQFYHVLPSEGSSTINAGFRGRVVTYRPQDSGQEAVPDFNSATSAAINWFTTNGGLLSDVIDGENASGNNVVIPPSQNADYILWARPMEVETDTDARRRWNVDDGKEDPVSLKTRKRTRVDFKWSINQPNSDYPKEPDDIPWTGVAKLLWVLTSTTDEPGTGGNIPQLIPISVWDAPQEYASTKEDVRVVTDDNELNTEVEFQNRVRADTVAGQTWDTYESYGTHDVAPPNPATQTIDVGGGGATSVSYLMSPGATARADLLKHGHLDYSNASHGNAAFGLIQILHLLRSRLRAHLGNSNAGPGVETTGQYENFFWAGAQPWWALPKYGLHQLQKNIETEETARVARDNTLTSAVESMEYRQFHDDQKIYGWQGNSGENGYANEALAHGWGLGMIPMIAGFARIDTSNAIANSGLGTTNTQPVADGTEYAHLPFASAAGAADGNTNFNMGNSGRQEAWGVYAQRNMPGSMANYDWLHPDITASHFSADKIGVYFVVALNPHRCHTIDVAQITFGQTFFIPTTNDQVSGSFGAAAGAEHTIGQSICTKVGIVSREKLFKPDGSAYQGDVPAHVFRVQLFAFHKQIGGSGIYAQWLSKYGDTDKIPEFFITFFGRKFRAPYASELVATFPDKG